MQAIRTKFLGATATKPSRIKAFSSTHSIIIPYDHALTSDDCHARAAQALLGELGWRGEWCGGAIDSNGFVFVYLSNERCTFGPRFTVA